MPQRSIYLHLVIFRQKSSATVHARAGAEEEAEDPGLQERLEAALAQCVFCLYGVDLPWRDEHWGGGNVEVSQPGSGPGITRWRRSRAQPAVDGRVDLCRPCTFREVTEACAASCTVELIWRRCPACTPSAVTRRSRGLISAPRSHSAWAPSTPDEDMELGCDSVRRPLTGSAGEQKGAEGPRGVPGGVGAAAAAPGQCRRQRGARRALRHSHD